MKSLLHRLLVLALVCSFSFKSLAQSVEEKLWCSIKMPNLQQTVDDIYNMDCAIKSSKSNLQEQKKIVVFSVISECLFGVGQGVGDAAILVGELIKALLVDVPKYAAQKMKKWWLDFWEKEDDAIELANEVHDKNLSWYKKIYQESLTILTDLFTFIDSVFSQEFKEWGDQLRCTPADVKAHLLCSKVVEFVAGGKLLQILGRKTYQKLKPLLAKMPKKKIFNNNNPSSPYAAALATTRIISEKVITKAGDREILERIHYDPKTGKKTTKKYIHDKKTNQTRELSMDPTGKAISANNEFGRQLALDQIEANAKNSSVMFIDVNNLGVVNYFDDLSAAGDKYLGSVVDSIAKNTGEGATIYRWGGDEFVVVLNTADTGKIQKIGQKIFDDVKSTRGPPHAIFEQQKQVFKSDKELVLKAKSFTDLPRKFTISDRELQLAASAGNKSVARTINSAEQQLAKTNFPQFKEKYIKSVDDALNSMKNYDASISIGSARVLDGSAEVAIKAADEQAASFKKSYKMSQGQDIHKYELRKPFAEEHLPQMPTNIVPLPAQ